MPVRPGDLTFNHISRFADDVVTVSDEAIVEAVLWAFTARNRGRAERCRQPRRRPERRSERSGRIEGPIVAVISGGNMGADKLTSGWRGADMSGSGLGARGSGLLLTSGLPLRI